MAKQRKSKDQATPVSDDRIKQFLRELDMAEQAVSDEREVVKDIMDTVKATGIHPKALKAAVRLSKMSAAEQNDWLQWFQRSCSILGVGTQQELYESNVVSLQ